MKTGSRTGSRRPIAGVRNSPRITAGNGMAASSPVPTRNTKESKYELRRTFTDPGSAFCRTCGKALCEDCKRDVMGHLL